MVDGREQNVYLAKLAEQAERYDEMAEHMKVVAQCNQETEEIKNNNGVLPASVKPATADPNVPAACVGHISCASRFCVQQTAP